ncbi:ectonucleotide pyrophosphatase/phosphodiesterase family member 7-like [Genypterus blacodes]|uniref:ectonucleotide pyrophosphatase/phosphodiesterase family member 7-like n=1 Tax=Genypterus blacodes TaxID=154954 RepID=UPI003F772B1C
MARECELLKYSAAAAKLQRLISNKQSHVSHRISWDSVSGLESVFTGSTRNKLLLISFDGVRWDYDRDVETPHLDKMAQDGVKATYETYLNPAVPLQHSKTNTESTFTATTRNKLLLISFDGFRWDYDHKVETPNLDKMAQDGVKATYVTPPFLTITSPAHFTMLTGKYVENHGVIHNMWFNTTTQEKKQYHQTQFIDSYWDNGSLPIWITAQRQGLKAGSLHFPGTAATYKGETVQTRQVEPFLYDFSNETDWQLNIDKVIGEWFHKQDLDFISLYFGEPDITAHKYGPNSLEVQQMVQQVDRTVGYIRDKVQEHGLTDRLNIIVTSDHGMAEIKQDGVANKIVLSKIPEFSFRDIQFQLLDYGPSGMLLPKEGKLEKVYQALKGAHPHLHVYKKEEMPARLRYSNHPRLLPIILLADPGYVVNGFLPLNSNKGEHGFDNEVLDMKAFFRAVGPDFQKSLNVGPFDLVEVYSLMCHLLGIKPEVNDGHLDNTKHMLLQQNPGGESDRRNIHHDAIIGLSAVVGFLTVVFIVTISYMRWMRVQKS